nr:TonB-dependent receptor [Pseudomonadota bacterium]
MKRFSALLVPGLLAGTLHSPLQAQQAQPAAAAEGQGGGGSQGEAPTEPEEEAEAGEVAEIVVTGQRLPGAVIGDIPPEITFDARDVRSFGAGNLAELLQAIGPQTRSGRGREDGPPVVLLNGQRISGFAEIRDFPPEAIVRVEVLPEEVALRYGYRADQRVVNFVLRPRFNAVTAETEGGFATEGGRGSYEGDLNYLRIDPAGRMNFDIEYQHEAPLLESERGLAGELSAFRTLLPETDQVALNATVNRSVLEDVSATLNGRFEYQDSQGRLGLRRDETRPLFRDTDRRNAHLGAAFNGAIAPWRWTVTGNYDRNRNFTLTDRNLEELTGEDRALSVNESANLETVANGPLLHVPAGRVNATLRSGFDTRSLRGESTRAGVEQSRDLSRSRGNFQANLDLPITSRRNDFLAAIGNLSANFNVEVERLSDFGTLRTVGYGLNWSPIGEVNFIASVTDEDGAPSIQQLGDPAIQTPNVRVFDFVRGETVDVTRIDGGNPALTADNRRVFKLGLNLRPLSETDLSLTANYTSTRLRNPISSFPTATPEIEAAFPERFVRDDEGRLLRIDTRPLNFARSDREEMRWGINFSKPLRSATPPGGGGFGGRRGGSGGAGAAASGAAGQAAGGQN